MKDESKLLYEQIFDYLKTKIVSNELAVDSKLPTELELAEQFGVSRITSKRALEELKNQGLIYRRRGSGSFVAPHKVEAVIKNVSSTIVEPVEVNNIIAIVLPFDASEGGMMGTISGASSVLNKNGFFVSIHSSHKDEETEKEILNNLFEQKVGGVILYPISDRENLETLNKYYFNDYPIVTIDKYFESIKISCVVSDNAKGAHDSTEYLINKGHDKIGFISDVTIESATSIRRRYFGYCQALKENRIMINEDYIRTGFVGEDDEEHIKSMYYQIVKELVEKGVTAIFCVNDYVASQAMRAGTELGVKIPEELALVGFDNCEFTQHMQVPLTTNEQDFYTMGQKAAEILISRDPEYKKVILPTKMILRESC